MFLLGRGSAAFSLKGEDDLFFGAGFHKIESLSAQLFSSLHLAKYKHTVENHDAVENSISYSFLIHNHHLTRVKIPKDKNLLDLGWGGDDSLY